MSVLALFVGILSFLPAVSTVEHRYLTVEPGQNIGLPCRAPPNTTILAVKWSKPGQGSKYVFFYRDGQPDPDNQDPAFMNHVELNDSGMKDGDLSLNLNNVTTEFAGAYKCQVIDANKETIDIMIVALNVREKSANITGDADKCEKNQTNGHSRERTGLVAALIVWIVFVFLIILKYIGASFFLIKATPKSLCKT